jgi:hypothetical protein
MRSFRFLVLATVAALGALLGPGRAAAHDINATVDVTADPVKVVTFSVDDDAPVEGADVTVTDAGGTVVATGKTDERGIWTFPRPKPGNYTLVVSFPGHRAKVDFTVGGSADGTVYTGWRMNKWLGLGTGVAVLLGISALSWFRNRRRSKVE